MKHTKIVSFNLLLKQYWLTAGFVPYTPQNHIFRIYQLLLLYTKYS